MRNEGPPHCPYETPHLCEVFRRRMPYGRCGAPSNQRGRGGGAPRARVLRITGLYAERGEAAAAGRLPEQGVHSRAEAVFDEQGRPVRIVGAHADISERKQAEEARRASEERLRQIVQQADCMLWQARVTESAGQFEWQYHVPASGLHRRIFGREYRGETGLYRLEQVPARPEMDSAARLERYSPEAIQF